MTASPASPARAVAGHSPDQERPRGYALLTSTFLASAAGFVGWFRRSGRPLPETMSTRDLALLTVAAHKLARTVTRDRVTSAVRAPFTRFQGDAGPGEVSEAARGRGLYRAVGECWCAHSAWACGPARG